MSKVLVLILAASVALAFIAPVAGGSATLAGSVLVLTSVLLGTVIQRALRRHDELHKWVAIELNKVRRVYHLGRNLGLEAKHRQWFTDLHGFVYAYLTAFDKKRFSQYQETNAAFRKLSYHLYQIPSLDSEKERVLYADLLEAAGLVAGARQRIQELWNGGLPSTVWYVLIAISGAAAAAILSAMGPSDRFTAALALIALFSVFALARKADDLRNLVGEDLTKKYVENLARLEMKREG